MPTPIPVVSPKTTNPPKPAQDVDLLFDLNPSDSFDLFAAPIPTNSTQKSSSDLDFFSFEPSFKSIPTSVTMPNLQAKVCKSNNLNN